MIMYDIVAVVDNDENKIGNSVVLNGKFFLVTSSKEILKYDYETIIITVIKPEVKFSIAKQLVDMGILINKIKTLCNGKLITQSYLLDVCACSSKSILMDVTNISAHDTKTGIPRTVNNLYINMKDMGIDVTPVQWVGKYITSNIYISKFEDKEYNGVESELLLQSGNRILLPDTSWSQGSQVFIELAENGVQSYVVIYDLIPIRETEIWSETDIAPFKEWINATLKYADNVICISKTVANDVVNYYIENHISREKSLNIFNVHLGFDINTTTSCARKSVCDFVKKGNTFLMVGVLGPQKNHLLALQAFERYYQDNPDGNAQLLVIGRDSYNNMPFKEMYYSCDILKDRVLWIDDAKDAELQWAYQNCSALLFPTKNEGFGLPLVEAAHFGLPIICSDIPVFKEVAGEYADYFTVNNVNALKDAITAWTKCEEHPDSGKMRIYSWKECAIEVFDILEDKAEPYSILR